MRYVRKSGKSIRAERRARDRYIWISKRLAMTKEGIVVVSPARGETYRRA